MARFVLVSIPDNADAEAFVAAMGEGYIMYSKPHPTLEGEVSINKPTSEWKVEALWADPTKLCECHPPWQLPNPIGKGATGLTCNPARSSRYGWLVCPQCSKPHPHQFQHPKNLLDPNETPASRTYCLGFRADRSATLKGSKDATA
jgi:hypothetical protein